MKWSGLVSRIDWLLVVPVIILILFSLTTLLSVGFPFFINQTIFVILSIGIFLFFSQVDIKTTTFYKFPIYIISLILLTIVLLIGIESHGAVRWIEVFGFRFQFSEILKPFILIFMAGLLTNKDKSVKTFLSALLYILPITFLIYKQPDLGNALIYFITILITLFICGFPWWWFAAGLGMISALIPFSLRFLREYQRQRIATFFHLTNDPLGSSYNAIQSIIAVGSGKLFGKGLGQGTQSGLRFLPERHTDFLFATLSEDLGFIGAGVVIICFLFLLYRLYIVFSQSDDVIDKVFVAGAFSLLLVQIFINIGMNIGLLPIVGVTLPFMSYGGSSLLSNAILLGLVSSVSSTMRSKHVLEIK